MCADSGGDGRALLYEVAPRRKYVLYRELTFAAATDVTGEAIRSKVVDTEKGVPLHLDFQLVDVTTCQPIKGQFVEMWSMSTTRARQ